MEKIENLIPYSNYVVFDLEWEPETGKVWEASFINERNEKKVLHIDDYEDDSEGFFGGRDARYKFFRDVLIELEEYEAKIGWGILGNGSDTEILNLNAKQLKMPSIVRQSGQKFVFIKGATIDLMEVFAKKIVQFSIFENGYRNLKLETVAQYFLGKGKLGDGASIQAAPKEKQKEYVLRDSELVKELMMVGEKKDGKVQMDGGILKLYNSITKIIEDSYKANNKSGSFPFDRVTQSNITTWWAQVLKNYNAPPSLPQFKQKVPFEGGGILDPKVGYYNGIEVVDVQSLYPTVIINYNVSHETICCSHEDCKTNMVPGIGKYWICKKIKGSFSERCKVYKVDRVMYKEKGDKVMATGLKIFLNGGFGAYGNQYFEFSDMRAAEIIPGIGRWITIEQMKPKAESLGLEVLYADTDSLFLHYPNHTEEERKLKVKELIEWAKTELDIVLEHEKTFKWLELVGKKHYLGKTTKGNLIIKGMEGKKGDRCKWVRESFDKVVDAIDKETDPTIPYKLATNELYDNKVEPDKLKIWTRLSKSPEAYAKNCTSKQVGELHQAHEGDVVWYFKAKKGVTLEYDSLDKEKYIKQLKAAVDDIINLKVNKIKQIGIEQWSINANSN